MKKNMLVFISIFVLFYGCASTQKIEKPKSLDDITYNKSLERKDKILLGSNNSHIRPFFVYIDEDNHLVDIRKNQNRQSKDDVILVYQNSFAPIFPLNTKNIQCGYGSQFGWLTLLDKDMLENHTLKNRTICTSRFTKLDSTQIGERLVFGMVTFGTTFVSGGNMHTVKFDENEFKEAIIKSNLDKYQKEFFFVSLMPYHLKNGLGVMYLKTGDIKNILNHKYKQLKNRCKPKDGLVFIDEDSKNILATIIFEEYRHKNIIKNISEQIEDLLNGIKKSTEKNLISKIDVLRYIPPKVKKPSLPPVPKLIKDEFETKKEFNTRVYKAVKNREHKIKELQKKYDLDIIQRNAYIKNLETLYKSYLEDKAKNKNNLYQEVIKNLPMLSKLLFLQNIGGFKAENFSYDAETQNLYFSIYSPNRYYQKRVVANIPAKIAKDIKLKKSFKIVPTIKTQNDTIILGGFDIYEPISDRTFNINYTNKKFVPIKERVLISTKNEKIDNNLISSQFKKYIQPQKKIADNTKKEIWYIDIVNEINAKTPKWYSNPKTIDDKIAYGEGYTLQEAKTEAIKELAYIIKVKISSTTTLNKEFNDSFKSYTEVKNEIKISSDIELSAKDYEVYRQEKVDGKWYVALRLIKLIK